MPPESTKPEQWPIHTYWQESNKRISQHWYISFCLMMSALQDYLTGLFLYEKDNLNWATTCFYYSMVHAGRLVSFCITGTYPTQHLHLRKLYDNQSVSLNWLNQFIKNRTIQDTTVNDFLQGASEFLETLGDSDQTSKKLKTFSEQLCSLGELRNDVNYESLIIAHEKYHNLVTEVFWDLSDAALQVSLNATSLAILTYKTYILKSSLLNDRREAFKCISNEYVSQRLKKYTQEKIKDSSECKKDLSKFCVDLKFEIDAKKDSKQASEIKKQISMTAFEPKMLRMSQFSEKVRKFVVLVSQMKQIDESIDAHSGW